MYTNMNNILPLTITVLVLLIIYIYTLSGTNGVVSSRVAIVSSHRPHPVHLIQSVTGRWVGPVTLIHFKGTVTALGRSNLWGT